MNSQNVDSHAKSRFRLSKEKRPARDREHVCAQVSDCYDRPMDVNCHTIGCCTSTELHTHPYAIQVIII